MCHNHRMKIQILLLCLGLGGNAFAAKCDKEVSAILKKAESKNFWTSVRTSQGTLVDQSPTKEIGTWVAKFKDQGNVTKIKILSPKDVTVFTFAKDCSVNESTEASNLIAHDKIKKDPKKYFTDKDLAKLVDADKGLIYVWSPRFVYSIDELPRVKKLAQEMGLKFTAVLARNVTAGELARNDLAKIDRAHRRLNASVELLMQKADLHSPTILVYKKGEILGTPVVGVYTKDALRKQLQEWL
jgi:hypothetical protein